MGNKKSILNSKNLQDERLNSLKSDSAKGSMAKLDKDGADFKTIFIAKKFARKMNKNFTELKNMRA